MRKATEQEKQAYDGLYPLHSVATVSGQTVFVEDLRREWSSPDPVWEIRAPEGFHFGNGEMTHGLFEHTLKDVREQLTWVELEACVPGCGCGCDYDA